MKNNKFWQDQKKLIKVIPIEQYEILIGCLLGDACMYKIHKNANVKMEQGSIHKDYPIIYIPARDAERQNYQIKEDIKYGKEYKIPKLK